MNFIHNEHSKILIIINLDWISYTNKNHFKVGGIMSLLPDTSKRVRLKTNKKSNDKICDITKLNIQKYLDKSEVEISVRLEELNKEWDTERVLETSASSFVLIGTIFGFWFTYIWFIFSAVIAVFFLQHALQGWCPPLPIIRNYGVRTSTEIMAEKASLIFIRDHMGKATKEMLNEFVENIIKWEFKLEEINKL